MCHWPTISAAALFVATFSGCPGRYRTDLDYDYDIAQHWRIDDVAFGNLAQFSAVDWHPDDTARLRQLIVDDRIAAGRNVLELGTQIGLVAILCLQHGADQVIAVDAEPAAVANARYNAASLESDRGLEVLRHDFGDRNPFPDQTATNRFDLVILNDIALDRTESSARSIDTFLDALPNHFQPGGRCFIFTQHLDRLRQWQAGAEQRQYAVVIHDERDLELLPSHFFPAALLEIGIATELLQTDSAAAEAG